MTHSCVWHDSFTCLTCVTSDFAGLGGDIGFFCGDVGLFCGEIGLFCRCIGFFCRDIWIFGGVWHMWDVIFAFDLQSCVRVKGERAHPYVWRGLFICVWHTHTTYSHLWHDSVMRVTHVTRSCLWHVWDMTVQYICNLGRTTEAKQLICMRDVTPSYVCYDVYASVTRLIHVLDIIVQYIRNLGRVAAVTEPILCSKRTHSPQYESLWHDSFICVSRLEHICDRTHSCEWHVSDMIVQYICNLGRAAEAKQHIRMCDMTYSRLWHDSFMCVTWLMHVCDMTHSCVWHDSFMCVTRDQLECAVHLQSGACGRSETTLPPCHEFKPFSRLRAAPHHAHCAQVCIYMERTIQIWKRGEKDQFLFTYISPVSIDIYEYIWIESGKREVPSHLPVIIHIYIIYLKRDRIYHIYEERPVKEKFRARQHAVPHYARRAQVSSVCCNMLQCEL